MIISIQTNEVVFNLKNKSHLEVAALPVEQRYIIEAGAEKVDEIDRCISEAYAEAKAKMWRFLVNDDISDEVEVSAPENGDYLYFDIKGTTRRLSGKAGIIADKLLSVITDLALGRFYASVNFPALAQGREARAISGIQGLERIVFAKEKPRLITI